MVRIRGACPGRGGDAGEMAGRNSGASYLRAAAMTQLRSPVVPARAFLADDTPDTPWKADVKCCLSQGCVVLLAASTRFKFLSGLGASEPRDGKLRYGTCYTVAAAHGNLLEAVSKSTMDCSIN